MLNTREWAIVFWSGVLLVLVLSHRKMRSSAAELVRPVVNPKLLIPFLAFIGWWGLEVWAATGIVRWNSDLTKGAVVWLITAGVLLFGGFSEAMDNPQRFFRDKARQTLAWPMLAEFYLELHHLPLWAELILRPALVALALVIVVAEHKKFSRIKTFSEAVAALLGLALAAYVTVHFVRGGEEIAWRALGLELALPIYLTLGALPFVFLLSLYATYETAFVRLEFKSEAAIGRRFPNRMAMLRVLHFHLSDVAGVGWSMQARLNRDMSFREACAEVRDYRNERRQEELRKRNEAIRLKKFVGVSGTDEEGKQLDRREFKETMEALRFLSQCMWGWYRRDKRYRSDMLEILDGSFQSYGLPEPAGIEFRVSKRGQAWFAWRRTITGWCFAIGASGPPPNEWLYDGPEPPREFPGTDPRWGTASLSEESHPNW